MPSGHVLSVNGMQETAGIRKEGGMLHNVYTVPTEVLKDNKARLKWVPLLWVVLDHSCFVLGTESGVRRGS